MSVFWILLVFLLCGMLRAFLGPSIWDRLLGMNLVAAKISLLMIVFASLFDLAYLLDVAIASTLLGFIGVIFLALFLGDHTKGGTEWWK